MFLKNAKLISSCGQRAILSRKNLLKVPKRNRYLVLVPEIGDDLPEKYPLLKEDRSPEYNTITVEKCVAAIGRQTVEFEEGVKSLGAKIKDVENVSPKDLFENVLNPMEEMTTSLNITWGIAKTLYLGNHSLMPTQYYVGIHERARRALASRYINLQIYQACKNIINNRNIELSNEQRRILSKFILEGKLNGLELFGRKQEELKAILLLMFRRIKEYSEKLEVAASQFVYSIKEYDIMKEFPEDVLKTMVTDTTKYNVGPWIVYLDPVITEPFMEYCSDRTLRYKVWEANVTKGSLFQEKSIQTSTDIEEIRFERTKRAKILGYKTYTDISMETKMAGNLENIYQTFDSLLETARPIQEHEIKELTTFALEKGLEGTLQPWDIAYWSRKQLSNVHKYNEEDWRKYFPLPKVLSGLFQLIETLFNAKIVESKKPDVWHKDVLFFDIFDLKQSSTDPAGSFYLDFYARGDEKVRASRDAGYVVSIQNRSKVSDTKPLVALIFNFQPPFGERPSMLSVRDLRTLFQKFGSMLQHTLTTVEYLEISGVSYVEWDTAFISDYFFENWLYEPFVLQQISCHEDTGEPLPMEMIKTLRNVKSHLAGYNLCKELYFSQFDLELHSGKEFWVNLMERLWKKYFVLPLHKKDYHMNSFKSVIGGDLAGNYYSNIWSQMIAADLYNAFEEVLSKDQQMIKDIGSRYRETFLALGGSYPMNEIFRKFRGRDPNPKALLKNLGLDAKSKVTQTAN